MSFIKKIFEIMKNVFNKKSDNKMIQAPIETHTGKEKLEFTKSLKVDIPKPKKKEVETMICYGDGLGIQNKINS